jgi:hypothetical protein
LDRRVYMYEVSQAGVPPPFELTARWSCRALSVLVGFQFELLGHPRNLGGDCREHRLWLALSMRWLTLVAARHTQSRARQARRYPDAQGPLSYQGRPHRDLEPRRRAPRRPKTDCRTTQSRHGLAAARFSDARQAASAHSKLWGRPIASGAPLFGQSIPSTPAVEKIGLRSPTMRPIPVELACF